VHALSITDDELMTLRGTHSLIDLYENAPREIQRIAPGELGVRRLGHFGPFRSEHEAQLWPRMAGWLGGLSARAAAAQ
jgi:predicted alpha/beta hydrolase